MDFWPRDQRTKKSKSTSIRSKATANEQARCYPNLGHGLLGAATLSYDAGRLNWIFVSENIGSFDESLKKRFKLGKQIQVFPPTSSLPLEAPKTSIKQRAEQGANFLRTYLPDIEIPEQLIRDHLIEDNTRSKTLQNFDPYSGTLIEAFTLQRDKHTIYAAFPTGETKRDLSYASIVYSNPSEILLRPSGTHLRRFLTPIQQIVTSCNKNTEFEDTNVAIRTYTSTTLFNIKWNDSLYGPSLSQGATITRKDLNNETLVDMKYLCTRDQLLNVGDRGSVFMCNISDGTQNMPLYNQQQSLTSNGDHFWRLACGLNPADYFLMTTKNLVSMDLRTNNAVNFFSLPIGKHVLTSMENCRSDYLLPLCSTKEIIWMDTRFPRNPLLAYAHGRQFDRYLLSHTLGHSSDDLSTLLTSRNNSLITAYNINTSPEGPIRSVTSPYCLPSDYSMYQTDVGQRVIEFDNSAALLRISESEGIIYNELLFSGDVHETSYVFERTGAMTKLVEQFTNTKEDIDLFSRQEFSQVDLQAAYQAIFREYVDFTQEFEQQTAEAVDEILDCFPSCLINKEFPTEYFLTAYDLAFRAEEDNSHATTASYLTESLVRSKRSYNALKQGELSAKLIKAPSHLSLLPTFQKFDKDIFGDLSKMETYLRTFRLSDDIEHANKIREYEDESSRQLIMDLALSCDIFSETVVSRNGDGDQTLENLTEALSLGDEPPTIEFGFLKPLKPKDIYNRDGGDALLSTRFDMPMGVRLLLQGWDTSDPEEYKYQDPYNAISEPLLMKIKRSSSQSQPQIPNIQSQRPPLVLTSHATGFSEHGSFRRTVPKVQSQSQTPNLLPPDTVTESLPTMRPQYDSSQSQEVMGSTQVLPGPHGGRPIVKKKSPKKRLGGF
ncbi:hypothetical protein BDN70DRAFT_87611 [Pholiota conissans]|uniref:RRN6 K-rich C-terminal domain-containing protein n=1 Tax=Pholiota conissans TaxID=109636 RepID=A0A9P5ZE26_9AGAR|nr:hypothetical protein BDN70DRAFT_87611 [Pholiota conissans]